MAKFRGEPRWRRRRARRKKNGGGSSSSSSSDDRFITVHGTESHASVFEKLESVAVGWVVRTLERGEDADVPWPLEPTNGTASSSYFVLEDLNKRLGGNKHKETPVTMVDLLDSLVRTQGLGEGLADLDVSIFRTVEGNTDKQAKLKKRMKRRRRRRLKGVPVKVRLSGVALMKR